MKGHLLYWLWCVWGLGATRTRCVSVVPDAVPSALSSVFCLLVSYGLICGRLKFPRGGSHTSLGTGWRAGTSTGVPLGKWRSVGGRPSFPSGN